MHSVKRFAHGRQLVYRAPWRYQAGNENARKPCGAPNNLRAMVDS